MSISICANQVKGTLTYEYMERVLSPPRYSGAFYPHHCIEEQTSQTYNISENKQIRCCYKMGKNAKEALLLEITRRLKVVDVAGLQDTLEWLKQGVSKIDWQTWSVSCFYHVGLPAIGTTQEITHAQWKSNDRALRSIQPSALFRLE